jgi:hypothetical protein
MQNNILNCLTLYILDIVSSIAKIVELPFVLFCFVKKIENSDRVAKANKTRVTRACVQCWRNSCCYMHVFLVLL